MRTSTLIRQRPIQGESHFDFLGESEGSLPPPHDLFPITGEAINDFWSMSGNFTCRHHVEPRVKLYSPREESFRIRLKYIDVSRTTHIRIWMSSKRNAPMIIGTSMGQEICLILEHVSLSLLYWKRKPPDGQMWSGERLTKRQVTSRPDYVWPQLWTKLGRNAKLKEKQKWSNEKPKLDSARRLRGIYFIDLRTRSSKKPLRMLERNWKHQWIPLCFAIQAKTVSMG